MKVLYYQCFSGISGDMNLAAMLSLGVDPGYLLKELSLLGLDEEFQINIHTEQRKGITGIRVDVEVHSHLQTYPQEDVHNYIHENDHAHNCEHNYEHNYEHTRQYDQTHCHAHQHVHVSYRRTLPEIQRVITESALPQAVQSRSLRTFDRLAEAEAKVHGIAKEQVHFHEVGAVDAIVDIVGAAICLEYLQVDKVIASRVELGGGFVHCEHGLLPVPAPAVLELIKGIPISTGKVQFETTTPTGAAILAANVDEFSDDQELIVEKIGYGLGKRELDIPNALRVILGTQQQEKNENSISKSLLGTTQYMIESNIDDMNPEFFELTEERLFQAGALDVFKTPIIMKKSRPAIKLSVLVNKDDVSTMEEIILRNTTAIGLRKYPVEKVMLARGIEKVQTKYGPIAVKVCYLDGKRIKAKPEFEDCKRIAKQNNLALNELYEEISRIL